MNEISIRVAKPEDAAALLEVYGPYVEQPPMKLFQNRNKTLTFG